MRLVLRVEGSEVCEGLSFLWEFVPQSWTDISRKFCLLQRQDLSLESFIVPEEWSC